MFELLFTQGMPWFRRFVADLSPCSSDFDARAGLVGFLMENMTLMHVSLRKVRLHVSSTIPPLIHNHISFFYQQ
jgi:hypothetical protein